MSKRKDQSFAYQMSDEEFTKIVQESVSFTEIKRKVGYKTSGHDISPHIKSRVKELNLDISHFMLLSRRHRASTSRKYEMKEILVDNSTYRNNETLKNRLIKDGYVKNMCDNCGLEYWNNEKLSLQLHHVNGINNDNRIENLQLLCPNCHSQTDFFSGRMSCERHKRRLRKIKTQSSDEQSK